MAGKLNGPKMLTEGLVYSTIEEAIKALEAGEDVEVDTAEEGIALALALCAPGEFITIHEEHCESDDNGEGCTCNCTTLVAGAQA